MGVHPKNLTKGYIVNEDNNEILKFQFNPEEWYTEHSATFEEIESPGSSYPMIFYSGRKLERIPLTLHFYGLENVTGTYTSTQIERYFETLTKPAKIQKNIISGSNHFISPPICTFGFGSKVYSCVCESAKIVRKMFNSKLKTIQMEVEITLIKVRLRLPKKTTTKKKATAKKTKKKKKTQMNTLKKSGKYVIIKNSESKAESLLKAIAAKYGVKVSKLKKLNKTWKKKVDSKGRFKKGTKIRYK